MEFKHPIIVAALPDYILELRYDDHEVRRFDVKPYLNHPFYGSLKNPAIFNAARIGHGTVVWPGDIDMAPDDLYFNSKAAG